MLEIREYQMDALSGQQVEEFVIRMKKRLHQYFDKEIVTLHLDQKGVDWLIRKGLADANRYRVVRFDDVEVYIEGMVVFSPNYDSNPNFDWAGKILRRNDIEGSEKMDLINNYMLFSSGVDD